ncbi:MAG: hypothetical protein IK129_01210 [Deltaproteobacteria bacterium]|nr:hypothetical protein [Deltaproteobacteria bacterium]
MKHAKISSIFPVPALFVLLALLVLPFPAPALTGSGSGGESKCIRFKGGQAVKSGACVWSIGITNEFDVSFPEESDEQGMAYTCSPSRADLPDKDADKLPDCVPQVYPLPGKDRKHCTETDVMPGETCSFSLGSQTAVLSSNPPKPGNAWFCVEKTGTDEILCMKRGTNYYGEGECARFKAGRETRSGVCDMFGDVVTDGESGECRFPDEKEDHGVIRNCAPDTGQCLSTLDGRPAAQQKNPVKGKGWTCFEQDGTDEVMCIRDANGD